jgi:hypothetical protein
MFFRFLNSDDNFTADVFTDHVRIARQGDTTGATGGAQSMSFETFYQIAALVAAADPEGPLGGVDFGDDS